MAVNVKVQFERSRSRSSSDDPQNSDNNTEPELTNEEKIYAKLQKEEAEITLETAERLITTERVTRERLAFVVEQDARLQAQVKENNERSLMQFNERLQRKSNLLLARQIEQEAEIVKAIRRLAVKEMKAFEAEQMEVVRIRRKNRPMENELMTIGSHLSTANSNPHTHQTRLTPFNNEVKISPTSSPSTHHTFSLPLHLHSHRVPSARWIKEKAKAERIKAERLALRAVELRDGVGYTAQGQGPGRVSSPSHLTWSASDSTPLPRSVTESRSRTRISSSAVEHDSVLVSKLEKDHDHDHANSNGNGSSSSVSDNKTIARFFNGKRPVMHSVLHQARRLEPFVLGRYLSSTSTSTSTSALAREAETETEEEKQQQQPKLNVRPRSSPLSVKVTKVATAVPLFPFHDDDDNDDDVDAIGLRNNERQSSCTRPASITIINSANANVNSTTSSSSLSSSSSSSQAHQFHAEIVADRMHASSLSPISKKTAIMRRGGPRPKSSLGLRHRDQGMRSKGDGGEGGVIARGRPSTSNSISSSSSNSMRSSLGGRSRSRVISGGSYCDFEEIEIKRGNALVTGDGDVDISGVFDEFTVVKVDERERAVKFYSGDAKDDLSFGLVASVHHTSSSTNEIEVKINEGEYEYVRADREEEEEEEEEMNTPTRQVTLQTALTTETEAQRLEKMRNSALLGKPKLSNIRVSVVPFSASYSHPPLDKSKRKGIRNDNRNDSKIKNELQDLRPRPGLSQSSLGSMGSIGSPGGVSLDGW